MSFRAVVEDFDLGWDLQTNYQAFCAACASLPDVSINPASPPKDFDQAHLAAYVGIGRCCVYMYDVLYQLERAAAWETLLEPRLKESCLIEHAEMWARAWDALGRIAYRRGEYIVAAERFREAVDIMEAAELWHAKADLYSNWLRADYERRRLTTRERDAALAEKFAQALQEQERYIPDGPLRTTMHRRGLSNVLHNLAVALRPQKRFQEAITYHQRAETINRELGDRYRLAQTRFNLGLVYMDRGEDGDWACAEQLFQEVNQSGAWQRGKCFALQNLAKLCKANRNYPEAKHYYNAAWHEYTASIGEISRDFAFEEWTLLEWWEVANEQRPELFSRAISVLDQMRTNLRHVLFRRDYPRRVMSLLEEGLALAQLPAPTPDHELETLTRWSAQEIADLASLTKAITPLFDEVNAAVPMHNPEIAGNMRSVRDEVNAAVPMHDPEIAGSVREVVAETLRIDSKLWECLAPQVQRRHANYLRLIEQTSLHPEQQSWAMQELKDVLPEDAAVVAYFWPEKFPPKAYLIRHNGPTKSFPLHLPLPSEAFLKEFDTAGPPSNAFREKLFSIFLAPM